MTRKASSKRVGFDGGSSSLSRCGSFGGFIC
jgi:hypothetical protein